MHKVFDGFGLKFPFGLGVSHAFELFLVQSQMGQDLAYNTWYFIIVTNVTISYVSTFLPYTSST